VSNEITNAGKPKARPSGKSSDFLTPLKPEREFMINPTAYLRWRGDVMAHEMGEDVTREDGR